MSELSDKNRLKYIDVARGIAMICIVLGHLGINEINRFVFTFHVPLFYIITGFFIDDNGKISDFIKKKLRSLILPYATACVLIIVLSVVLHIASTPDGKAGEVALSWLYASVYGSGGTYHEPFYIKSIGALWFLLASFWGSLFLRLILKFNRYIRIASVIVLFLAGYFSRNLLWLPLSVQSGMCALLFMYVGYLCKGMKNTIDSASKEIKTAFIVFAFVAWTCFVIDFKSFWLVNNDIGRGFVDIVSSLCAVFCVIFISKNIITRFMKPVAEALGFIGKYSIIMLCAHIIELNLFPWNRLISALGISELRGVTGMIILISGKFLWCFSVTYICSKRKFTRRIFGLKTIE